MPNVFELCLDAKKQIGEILWLEKVRPFKATKEGEVDGFRYDVYCIEKSMLKLSVKIPGAQLLNPPATGYVPVEFTNLELKPYVAGVTESIKDGKKNHYVEIGLSAMAKGIKAVQQQGK